jgi:hypothetical protein
VHDADLLRLDVEQLNQLAARVLRDRYQRVRAAQAGGIAPQG